MYTSEKLINESKETKIQNILAIISQKATSNSVNFKSGIDTIHGVINARIKLGELKNLLEENDVKFKFCTSIDNKTKMLHISEYGYKFIMKKYYGDNTPVKFFKLDPKKTKSWNKTIDFFQFMNELFNGEFFFYQMDLYIDFYNIDHEYLSKRIHHRNKRTFSKYSSNKREEETRYNGKGNKYSKVYNKKEERKQKLIKIIKRTRLKVYKSESKKVRSKYQKAIADHNAKIENLKQQTRIEYSHKISIRNTNDLMKLKRNLIKEDYFKNISFIDVKEEKAVNISSVKNQRDLNKVIKSNKFYNLFHSNGITKTMIELNRDGNFLRDYKGLIDIENKHSLQGFFKLGLPKYLKKKRRSRGKNKEIK